ncbi:MAG: helix-turn-helix transcriptional regulator [Synergistaceae bacterium]|nr:helix-turn-helix transcriptional regulator [Synergistaceae bacterium]
MKGMGELRRKLRLTKAALAEKVGGGVNTIARYERGEMEPSLKIAHVISEVLGCTEAELLNGAAKQEFEVKIVMGVKSLSNATGIEIKDDSLVYGIDDEKSRICLGNGMIDVSTLEQRKDALRKIISKFQKACWMLDHKDETEAKVPDFDAIFDTLQLT